LYNKKDKFNGNLYRVHLQAAKDWGKMCYPIQNSTQDSLNVEMEKKYKNIDDKIKKLVLTQAEFLDTEIQFYPRVINMTDIVFTDEEMTLLNKGLKYDQSYKRRHWISYLTLEAENAITLLPVQEQDRIRYEVAYNLEKLYKQQREKHIFNNRASTYEFRIANQIKTKLNKDRAMITKADKGNKVIITYTSEYNKKVNNFINSNNFIQDISNITSRLQHDIRRTINECQHLVPKENRWKYLNMNSTAPTIRGWIKIHKAEAPMRPIIN
jgi:hypothetical protein